ncbi:group II truncated hemoglobin [Thiomicrorhabdus sp.]|uniref:group II truncated hemoglobin n=1 Tax=Thiomicrorhabdus sp. TaxID=2039724 RepID=UPI0029C860AF|nr:group II truncated hemoglobin [Thiomicrorhabdus sp.]
MLKNHMEYGMGDATYQAVGGYEGLVKLVDDFYLAMETVPEAKHIRSMHRQDLSESRDKLTHFLSGWMNGPQIYMQKYGSINIPQVHAFLDVGDAERDAWLLCMQIALKKQAYPAALQEYLLEQLFKPAERIRQVSQEARAGN